jgi:hypothetical protein
MADLCSVYPLMDVHLGMHAWGRETSGDDYDLKLALGDMLHAFAKVMAITPPSDTGVLIIGGDFFHADNNNAETPATRHKLDVDGRFDKIVDGGIAILVETIDRLLTRHASVIVRALSVAITTKTHSASCALALRRGIGTSRASRLMQARAICL